VTLKNVASDSEATALASMVLPLPGGPKRSKPKIKGSSVSTFCIFILKFRSLSIT